MTRGASSGRHPRLQLSGKGILVFSAVFSQLWTQYSLDRALLWHPAWSFSGRSQLRSGQNQKVVGDDGTPDVPTESLPAFPSAAIKAESALEGGYPGLDAGPEVAQFFVNPGTLGHVEYR